MTRFVLTVPGDGTWNLDLGADRWDLNETELSNNDTISFDGDRNADDLDSVVFEKRGSTLVLTSPGNSDMRKISVFEAATFAYTEANGWENYSPQSESTEEIPEPTAEELDQMLAEEAPLDGTLSLLEEALEEQAFEDAVMKTPTITTESPASDLEDYGEHEFLVALEKVSKIQYDLGKRYSNARLLISQLELEAVERDEEIESLKEEISSLSDELDELSSKNEDMANQLKQITEVLRG